MLQTLSHLFQPNSFNSSDVDKFVLGFNSERLYRISGKEKNVVVLCSRCLRNVNLDLIFTSQSCSDGKEMYKKVWCTWKVVFCQSKPISIAFLPFSLSLLSSSPLLKLPIVYKRVCFVKGVNKAKQYNNYFLWKKVVVLFSSITGKDNSLLLFCLVHVLYKTREIRHLITSLLLQRTKNRDALAKLLFC